MSSLSVLHILFMQKMSTTDMNYGKLLWYDDLLPSVEMMLGVQLWLYKYS